MPSLVRFVLTHAAIGFAIAVGFVGAILALDVFGLGRMVRATEGGWVAAAALTFLMGVTFASAQIGFAVFSLREREDGAPPPRR